jgi:hypothetical protein
MRTLAEIEALAALARPVEVDEGGAERQVAAQNAFFQAVSSVLTGEQFGQLEEFCSSPLATVDEMIDEAMRLIRGRLS